MFTLCVPREEVVGEKRVAATPETVKKFVDLGFAVVVERDAGLGSFFPNEAYEAAGATLMPTPLEDVSADLVLTVRGFSKEKLSHFSPQASLIGLLGGQGAKALLQQRVRRAFSLELLPRVSRAQPMDVLSSQSTIAGYWAVLEAAHRLPRLFPLLMTAAGTVPPARVLILGAGVAGLQAVATARRLGAIVSAFDVRTAAREQVESLGAAFVMVDGESGETTGGYAQEMGASYQERQAEKLRKLLPQMDVVIGTALIPGKPAPRILSEELMGFLKPGSLVIDLAVESGGNCAFSRPQETVLTSKGVTVVGEGYPANHYPQDASALYARNLLAFVKLLWDADGKTLRPTDADDLLKATCVYEAGV